MSGPAKKDLVEKILNELKKRPDGVWIRKLSRILNEPVMTIHKYINRKDYVGKYVTVNKLPKEEGGHMIILLKEFAQPEQEVEQKEPLKTKDISEITDDYYIS